MPQFFPLGSLSQREDRSYLPPLPASRIRVQGAAQCGDPFREADEAEAAAVGRVRELSATPSVSRMARMWERARPCDAKAGQFPASDLRNLVEVMNLYAELVAILRRRTRSAPARPG